MLLSKGYVAYLGPGGSDNVIDYFKSLGYACPLYCNVADFVVDIITVDSKTCDSEAETSQRLQDLVDAYQRSSIYHQFESEINVIKEDCREHQPHIKWLSRAPKYTGTIITSGRRKAPLFTALYVLLCRMYINLIRTAKKLVGRIMTFPFFAVILFGFIYRLQNDQQGVQNRIGLLFQSVTSPLGVTVLNAMESFPVELNTYCMEHRDGAYSALAFFLTYCLSTLSIDLIASVIFSCILYWGTGLQANIGDFFTFYLVIAMMQIAGDSIGCIFCCIFKETSVANTFSFLVVQASILMSGFFRSSSAMPTLFRFLNKISILQYATNIVMIQEFAGLTFTCPESDILPNGQCKGVTSGDQVLSAMDINPEHKDIYIIGLVVCAVGYRCVMYLFLRFVHKLGRSG